MTWGRTLGIPPRFKQLLGFEIHQLKNNIQHIVSTVSFCSSMSTSLPSIAFKAIMSPTLAVPLPTLALTYERPSEGLPLLQDWVSNATAIYVHGFEASRESIEVRPVQYRYWPEFLGFGHALPTKGLGKTSMLLFGMVYSYTKLRESMTPEECTDFLRPGTHFIIYHGSMKGSS